MELRNTATGEGNNFIRDGILCRFVYSGLIDKTIWVPFLFWGLSGGVDGIQDEVS